MGLGAGPAGTVLSFAAGPSRPGPAWRRAGGLGRCTERRVLPAGLSEPMGIGWAPSVLSFAGAVSESRFGALGSILTSSEGARSSGAQAPPSAQSPSEA